ncbi:ras-like GTPase Ras1 [Basidiobolus meristosporus CBS 931.73]|uniref:small monomeric GTPase n=1 Tax=Basidiobolus meristosporus CBS 931.73 TaxID=1314790 RepID=A0A1Y1YZJ0_9FUNG|nr:ras-like GTPase Ras1 [Basidiobolus meristosporus CBS 931.73]|eukprot:ORY03441.1 ras-like GTPase Ras1 [Basidiobolus meristosporus CBS 931.73]
MLSSAKYSVVILGGGGVGKSAITLNFVRKQFVEEYDPTIEDCYCKALVLDGVEYNLDITDTAGQEEYRGLFGDKFMRQGDGFICVYSITSKDSLEELDAIVNQIYRAKEGEPCPIVIVGNKCDLEQLREVSVEQGRAFAQHSNASFLETSAKTRINIDEAFELIVQEIRRQTTGSSPVKPASKPTAEGDRKDEGSHCCIVQ